MRKQVCQIIVSLFFTTGSHTASADTGLIKNLDTRDVWTYNYNASHWIEQANFQARGDMYGEVAIQLNSIPAYLKGSDWIQTAYGSKNFTGQTIASFQLTATAEVYIAHNKNIVAKPKWLLAYKRAEGTITNASGAVFELYKKIYNKNSIVELSANGSTTEAMYIVIVKPVSGSIKVQKPSVKLFDIASYGAVGDNKTVNTPAIQKAIDECSASGGGAVYIHNGIFVSGTLELKDNVQLFVEAGSILRASANHDDYPAWRCSFQYYRGKEDFQFIYAEKKKNIGIAGGGIIDGFSHGDSWPWKGKNNEHERPRLIRMVECTNVNVHDISLIRSANWTQLYEGCDKVTLTNVRVRVYTGQNNQDGVDISSCNGFIIKNFYTITGDDAICLKAMSQKKTENVFVDGLLARYANCNAVKIGTETHGDVQNIHVKNVVANTRYGIAVEAVDGSNIDGVLYEDFTLTSCSTPLFIRLGDRGRTYEGGPQPAPIGSIKNVTIRNVTNTDIGYVEVRNGPGVGSAIGGLPERKIENLVIENCNFLYYGSIQDTAFVYQTVPENRDKYPEFNIYGTCPAYGLYFRHINGLTVRNTKVRVKNLDVRPAVVLDDVTDYKFSALHCEEFPFTEPSVIWDKQKGNTRITKSKDNPASETLKNK
ncbi:MAG TPA: glycosyl hydrolase family 28 protein [Chitinophagaceae bacterium]